MFRHCALITWYLINDWQKYWQKLAKDYKTSTLYFHFPRQLARESESRAQPHSPDRDQEKICSLHELVFAIHPCFRVKISDSDAFISFSSLGTWEISHHLHFKVRKQWNRHHSAMLLLDMFPEWLVGSPLQSQNHTLPDICSPTVGRSHTSAHSAIMHLHKQAILEFTSKHIP